MRRVSASGPARDQALVGAALFCSPRLTLAAAPLASCPPIPPRRTSPHHGANFKLPPAHAAATAAAAAPA